MARDIIHSVRVAYENWIYESRFNDLIRILKEHPSEITQVALFTTAVHTPTPLEELSRRTEIMKKRMETLRLMGFSAGINILPTVGHHCEDLENSLGDRYTYMTDIEGNVCKGSYCIRNARYHEEYVVPCYTLLANANPDFIWIDDDIRLGHMPIGKGGFCDGCIGSFNKKYGIDLDRQSLREALNRFDVPFRKKWLDHNSDAICSLFRVIGKTVRDIDDSIVLGFMTGERYFEGYQFENYALALSDNGKYEIMWRPGGGAYEDRDFDKIVAKQEDFARQNAYLPGFVTTIQSEIENFPYNLIKKTPKSTAVEAAMSMTAGCTGAAFNILPSETLEPMDTVIPHIKAIASLSQFYKTESRLFKGLSPQGIHTGWRIDSQAAVPENEYFTTSGGRFASYAREMFSFGLPECYHKDKADVVMLKGTSAAVMSDDEIRSILSKGLYLDADALSYLEVRGFSQYLGFSKGKEIPVDARELFLEHEINEGLSGGIRNCRQAFHKGDSFALDIRNEKCEILSSLIDYHDKTLCECACGIFENPLNGTVCVGGYYPHDWLSDYYKTVQLKRLFVRLSKGTLPSFVESYCRIRNITLTGEGRCCVTLFNTSNDLLENISVAILTGKKEALLHTMYEGAKKLERKDTKNLYGGDYGFFTIDRIEPYEGIIIEL